MIFLIQEGRSCVNLKGVGAGLLVFNRFVFDFNN